MSEAMLAIPIPTVRIGMVKSREFSRSRQPSGCRGELSIKYMWMKRAQKIKRRNGNAVSPGAVIDGAVIDAPFRRTPGGERAFRAQ
jgi:hypothetical protein